MQAEIKKKHCEYADYCPCAAHFLNLVGESVTSCCIESCNPFRLSMNFITCGPKVVPKIFQKYVGLPDMMPLALYSTVTVILNPLFFKLQKI